jgi:hypothetical protein
LHLPTAASKCPHHFGQPAGRYRAGQRQGPAALTT